ncbi:hypothetical protein [Labilibaculum euxinus]|uniref:TRASH domain-containing protein n=1 Tax=Labilibaculum euxinus TaxID=2686357 RepID=A0A7M4D9S3_9BACT|nr:hypothetical protein [Labilibaculum euxinus]MUP39402.1 hypothetical protein [Labilibaculum euxinus]MVB08607.1 hypothetical protein [Labilibaculum euxinus]
MKKSNKNQKRSRFGNANEIKALLILGLIILLVAIVVYAPVINERDKSETLKFSSFEGKEMLDNMVCMVRGDIKSKSTLPIQIEDKTYRGCCQKCMDKLERNVNNIRFTIDPITGQSINKADAVIKQDPHDNKRVLFFKSNETYNQYLKIINKK